MLYRFFKAFDREKHTELVEIMKEEGLDSRDVRIIENLYWNQTAYVNIAGNKTEETKIQRGFRQGYVFSPTLFNIYSKKIFQEALEGSPEEIIINVEIINKIRYADDTVILASSLEDLQTLLEKINATSVKYGLNLNTSKTKYMTISKNALPPMVSTLNIYVYRTS